MVLWQLVLQFAKALFIGYTTIMNLQFQKIKKTIPPILKSHGVKRAAVFGSVARGDNNRSSDVDLLVEFNGRKSLLDLIGLQFALQKKYRRKFDVVTYRSLHPLLRDRIMSEQRPIL